MLAWFIAIASAALPTPAETCNGLDDDLDGEIDEGAACTGCSQVNGAFGDSWLACHTPVASQAAAVSACNALGYDIADITSNAENVLLQGPIQEGSSYWQGINDIATEGAWVTSTGATATYFSWDTGIFSVAQPDGGTAENCVYVGWTLGYGWFDASCTLSGVGSLCEAQCTLLTFYEDADGDGYGAGPAYTACGPIPSGASAQAGDCDDGRAATNPGATEQCNSIDDDCDGATDELWTDGDGDGVLACQNDCDDDDGSVHPGAIEVCNLRDDDCDGFVDENMDSDGDGFSFCNGDCDDGNPDRWPGAAEDDDGLDDDCDGQFADGPSYYLDRDGDGYGDPTTGTLVPGNGRVQISGDCDDRSASRHPGATEVCNGVDDDCTGWVDDGNVCGNLCLPIDTPSGRYLRCAASVRYGVARDECRLMGWQLANPETADEEADILKVVGSTRHRSWWHGANDIGEEDVLVGFDGTPSVVTWTAGQPNEDGDGQDCAVFTPRPDWETHDRSCDNSNGYVCETCTSTPWWFDLDGDGTGAGDPVYGCEKPDPSLVAFGGDCDDGDSRVGAGVAEICDGLDNDCDGDVDEGPALMLSDADADGYGTAVFGVWTDSCATVGAFAGDCDDGEPSVSPLASETCNGVDDDCDGLVDEDGCGCDAIQDGPSLLLLCGDTHPDESWSDARAECQAYGYDLAILDTPDRHRHAVLESGIREFDDIWIGLEADATAGAWAWVDGSPTTYERWGNNQPSGNGSCGALFASSSLPMTRWNDTSCENVYDYLCGLDCSGLTVYRDADGDGDGDASISKVVCSVSQGWTTLSTDCDDRDPFVAGRFSEACDGRDNDCNGVVDDNLPVNDWFVDGDEDGFGDVLLQGCVQPPGTVAQGGDCDDANGLVFPGAPEACEGTDEDCDGVIDNDAIDIAPGFLDDDGDGYGTDATAGAWCPGEEPSNYAALGGDCDDSDATVSPGEAERCGGGDEDCDGLVDDADDNVDPATQTTFWTDGDGDGYGEPGGASVQACTAPSGFAATQDDCNDEDPDIHPGALDYPVDGIDQNCDGADTSGDADSDGDGLLDGVEIDLGSNPYDADTDGDGVRDPDEMAPGPTARDTDGDGVPDHSDPDDDGDGIPTAEENTTDTDGDGVADYLDTDSDGDGVLDGAENEGDSDGDGVIDRLDPGGVQARPPPEPEPGCGCSTGGPGGAVWLLALLGYRRSRARRASSRRARSAFSAS